MQLPEIRPLQEADEIVVCRWLTDYLEDHIAGWIAAYGLDWSREDIRQHVAAHDLVRRDWLELLAASDAPDRLVQVAVSGGRPVGLVHAERRLDRYLAVSIGNLSWLYVAPDCRRRGIGRQLLASAQDWMKAHGMRASEVFVTAESSAALHVYLQAGYQVLDYRAVAVCASDWRTSRKILPEMK